MGKEKAGPGTTPEGKILGKHFSTGEQDIPGLAGNTQRPIDGSCHGGSGTMVCRSSAISGLSCNMLQEPSALFVNLFMGGTEVKGMKSGLGVEDEGPCRTLN